MFDRASSTSFATLALSSGGEWKVDVLDASALQKKVTRAARQGSLRQVQHNHEIQCQTMSRGHLPLFAVEDCVLVARVRWTGLTPKVVSTSTGPWRVVTTD